MELILIIVGGTLRDPLRCWPGALQGGSNNLESCHPLKRMQDSIC
jgi:hypothetical protein